MPRRENLTPSLTRPSTSELDHTFDDAYRQIDEARRKVRPDSFLAQQLDLAEKLTKEVSGPVAHNVLGRLGLE